MSDSTAPSVRFPDFLCIGAQKAGTTWLDANLRRHPGIWMPWIKELQYFNDIYIPGHRGWTQRHRHAHAENAARRLVARSAGKTPDTKALERIAAIAAEPISDEWYGRIFAEAGQGRICGEVTPEYSLLPPEGIAHVRRLNPGMKIIFLMREPVERCWSHLRMLARGRQNFDHLAAAGLQDVIDRSRYGDILGRWVEVFGSDAVFTARIEDVSAEPEPFLRAVVAFLGLEWSPAVAARASEPVFVGPAAAMPEPVRERLRATLAGSDPIPYAERQTTWPGVGMMG